jgi:hypothetical protein
LTGISRTRSLTRACFPELSLFARVLESEAGVMVQKVSCLRRSPHGCRDESPEGVPKRPGDSASKIVAAKNQKTR